MATIVLDAAAIGQALERMADTIFQQPKDGPWAVVGIRRGGDHLAERLADLLGKRSGVKPPVGVVDITLYRDDGFGPHQWPQVGVTHIPFALPQHTVVLVDDVLYTGRTTRAAINELFDYGRPASVKLVVLVDRGGRELPVQPDLAIARVALPASQSLELERLENGQFSFKVQDREA